MHSESTNLKQNRLTGLVEKDTVVGAVVGVLMSAKMGFSRQVREMPRKPLKSRLLRKKKSRNLTISRLFGGDKRVRTADLLNAIQALSQLSYTPKFRPRLQTAFVL